MTAAAEVLQLCATCTSQIVSCNLCIATVHVPNRLGRLTQLMYDCEVCLLLSSFAKNQLHDM